MKKMNFRDFDLSDDILRAIEGLNYEKPTRVQQEVIEKVLQDKDIIVKSQTGSGKTAAFAIPICEKIEWDQSRPQALVLVPTRELAVQVTEDISNIGKFKRIKAAAVFGKQPFSIQQRELKQRTHVVAGTPGRVMDHIQRQTVNFDDIKYLVLDEADQMLDMGFIDQVSEIIELLPKERVTMLFSATIPSDIEKLCDRYMNCPERVDIESETITADSIEHFYLQVSEKNKPELLIDTLIVENPDSCIIFCCTKEQVDKVYENLKKLDCPCSKIHGGMLQEDRLKVMKEFKRGEFIYLAATDVAARGIDIENVTHIINYDIPLEKESYVHRTGRTGRKGNAGKAITFVTEYQERFLSNIEEYIGFPISKIERPSEEKIESMKKAFEDKIFSKPEIKKDKAENLNREITKLYFNAGKKKKMRPGDFVGAITGIEGVEASDIGIIDIQDHVSYVDILNGKGEKVLNVLKDTRIKGKELRVQKARK